MSLASTTPQLLASPRRRRTLVGLTPLIDVVFSLLIFFMLASSFLSWRAIDLNAPVRAAAGVASNAALLIELAPDGMRLDDSETSLSTLTADLSAALAERSERGVLIQPSAGVPLQQLVLVLDAVKASGVDDVQLVHSETVNSNNQP